MLPLIKEVHDRVDSKIPPYICITEYYNVCANSFITGLSWALLQRYNRVWKHNNETNVSYNDCPAIMEAAMDVIEPEINRIKNEKHEEAVREAKRGHK